jgi:hypothetical protein
LAILDSPGFCSGSFISFYYNNNFLNSPFRRFTIDGAHDQDRTGDLVLTKDALYRLSYVGWVPAFAKASADKPCSADKSADKPFNKTPARPLEPYQRLASQPEL